MDNDVKKPKHVAFVMDGNRRWATERGLPKMFGHTEGAKTMKKVMKRAVESGIEYVTFWALSTENLKERSEDELKHLFSLFCKMVDYLSDLEEEGVRVRVIGNISGLPKDVQQAMQTVEDKTAHNTRVQMILAVNYGGRDEIRRAVQKIVNNIKSGELVTEDLISDNLDTAGIPYPDLVIRTGGKSRLSGFLPWQTIYSEIYLTNTLWPDFDEIAFDEAFKWYTGIERNFGK